MPDASTPPPVPPQPQPIDLKRRFPLMRDLKGVPALFTLNGCGFSLYGRRDFDQQTHTYVKTRFISLVFVPVFPWDAYRVADAAKGWYFIGKEPLGKITLGWQRLVAVGLVALLIGSGWDS